MQMFQFQIGQQFPLVLICLQDGSIALAKKQEITVLLDHPEQSGVEATFDNDSFDILGEEGQSITLQYNTTYQYKTIPLLLAWLEQQNLQM